MRRVLVLLVFTTSLVMTAAGAAVQASSAASPVRLATTGAVWTAPHQLSRLPSDAPTLVSSADDLVAAWREYDGAHWRVTVATRTDDGSWSTPQWLSAPDVDAGRPVAVANPNVVLVTWRLVTGEIQESVSKPGTPTWSRPAVLQPSPAAGSEPQAGVTGDGWPVVAWIVGTGIVDRVHGAAVDAQGRIVHRWTLSGDGINVLDLNLQVSGDHVTVAWTAVVLATLQWQPQWRDVSAGRAGKVRRLWLPEPAGRSLVWGDVAAAWFSTSGGHLVVRGVLRRGPGRRWSSPVTVSAPLADASDVRGLLAGRRLRLVWLEHDASGTRVATTVGHTGNGRWDPVTYLSPASGTAQTPVLERTTDRGAVSAVDWVEMASGSHLVLRRALHEDGTWSDAEAVSPAGADATQPFPVRVGNADNPTPGDWPGSPGLVWVQPGPGGSPVVQVRGLDTTAPQVRISTKGGAHLGPTVELAWSAVDDWSSITGYEVRQAAAAYRGGGWVSTTLATETLASSLDVVLDPGTTYCWTVGATDGVGHVAPALEPRPLSGRCRTIPLDDRALSRSKGWKDVTGSRYYRGTALVAHERGATLRLRHVTARTVGLLLWRSPSSGRVRVSFAGRTVDLDLRSRHPRRKLGYPVLLDREHTGTLTLTVLSQGRPVLLDGVVVSRA